jgi:hypothetical protein
MGLLMSDHRYLIFSNREIEKLLEDGYAIKLTDAEGNEEIVVKDGPYKAVRLLESRPLNTDLDALKRELNKTIVRPMETHIEKLNDFIARNIARFK